MALSEIQEKTKLFEASNDALCLGLKDEELAYLRGLKVETTVIELSRDAKKIGLKFNIMILALDLNIFRLFDIIERHIDMLLINARVLVRLNIESDIADTKNVVAELSKPLRLQPEQYIGTGDGIWLILSRI